MTIRNWLIGCYIVEFEQHGEDRAKYGEFLLLKVSENINIKGFSVTNLKLFRQFYFIYPQIGQSMILKLENIDKKVVGISSEIIFNKLSFTYIVELLKIDYPKKNIMQPDDIPPVGILLCTGMNHALIEYATVGMDN